jgi:hypothetical protein
LGKRKEHQEKSSICHITLVSIKAKTKFQPTESQRVIGSEAFSYYSNKFNLEKARQFKQDDVQVIQTSGMSSQGQGPVKRRKGSKARSPFRFKMGDGESAKREFHSRLIRV